LVPVWIMVVLDSDLDVVLRAASLET